MASDKIYKTIKQLVFVMVIYSLLFAVIFFSKEISAGIRNGISLSANLLIPSMFFFMIFSNIMLNSKGKLLLSFPFRFLCKILYISEFELSILILSLIGGYPVGAKLLHRAIANGEIEAKRASSLLCFCVNCGPAFLISGVGVSIIGSASFGIILFISQIAACLVVAFFTGRVYRKSDISPTPSKVAPKPASFPVLLVTSVKDAIGAMCTICGFVLAFSACMPIFKLLLEATPFAVIFEGLLEVTAGCSSLSSVPPNQAVILAAVFTAFGGICVLLQVYAIQSGSKMNFRPFLIWRILYISVSVFVTWLLCTCFPLPLECFSVIESQKEIWSVSPLASGFLSLLCIMLLFFSRKSYKMKEATKK